MLKKLTAAFWRFFFARKSVHPHLYKHYTCGEKRFDRVIENPLPGKTTRYCRCCCKDTQVTMTISTPDADSFRKSQAQITREMRRNLGKGCP